MSAATESYHICQCGPMYIQKLIGGGEHIYMWLQQRNGEWRMAWTSPGAPHRNHHYTTDFPDLVKDEFMFFGSHCFGFLYVMFDILYMLCFFFNKMSNSAYTKAKLRKLGSLFKKCGRTTLSYTLV